MHSRKQLAQVIDQIIVDVKDNSDVEPSIVDEYKKLDEKCDEVICKIKNRKVKKNTKRSED